MSLFLSTYLNKVDKKCRVSIPARFRGVLQQQGGDDKLIVFRSFNHQSLEACGAAFIDELWKKLQGMNPFTSEQEDLLWAVIAGCCELAIDGDGRVVLPQQLIDYAQINDAALLVGHGDRFQIWCPELATKYKKEVYSRIEEKFAAGKNIWLTSEMMSNKPK